MIKMTSTRRSAAEKINQSAANSTEAASTSSIQPKDNIVSLSSINPYITCPLCNGYFVDATTVLDCLHTFCKSCLLKYFEDNTDCPKCHYQIHQSHPSHYVAFDRTMQDIVYKLVPNMLTEEKRRKDQFKQRQRAKDAREQTGGQSNGASTSVGSGTESLANHTIKEEQKAKEENGNPDGQKGCCCEGQETWWNAHRRADEPVLIRLVPNDQLNAVNRPIVRLSTFATVNTVKRLLAYLHHNDTTKYNEFDIFCNRELMGRDFSMAFIKKTRWRNKQEPVELVYREHLDF